MSPWLSSMTCCQLLSVPGPASPRKYVWKATESPRLLAPRTTVKNPRFLRETKGHEIAFDGIERHIYVAFVKTSRIVTTGRYFPVAHWRVIMHALAHCHVALQLASWSFSPGGVMTMKAVRSLEVWTTSSWVKYDSEVRQCLSSRSTWQHRSNLMDIPKYPVNLPRRVARCHPNTSLVHPRHCPGRPHGVKHTAQHVFGLTTAAVLSQRLGLAATEPALSSPFSGYSDLSIATCIVLFEWWELGVSMTCILACMAGWCSYSIPRCRYTAGCSIHVFMYSAVSWLSAPRIDKHSDEADKELHIYINRFILSLKLFSSSTLQWIQRKSKGSTKTSTYMTYTGTYMNVPVR